MTDPAPEPIIHYPAATVIIFRQPSGGGDPEILPEILMVQRSDTMRFAGGAAVFPGGRVDDADRALAASLALPFDVEEAAARIAGIRETLEETGLALGLTTPVSATDAAFARKLLLEQGTLAPVLQTMGWQLALDALVPFARWCPSVTRTFDTRFYLLDLGTGAVDIAVDATENTHLFWISAKSALRAAYADELNIIFPTLCNLERLAQFSSFAQTRAHAETTPIQTISAIVEDVGDERWLTIPPDKGYPVIRQLLKTAKRGFATKTAS